MSKNHQNPNHPRDFSAFSRIFRRDFSALTTNPGLTHCDPPLLRPELDWPEYFHRICQNFLGVAGAAAGAAAAATSAAAASAVGILSCTYTGARSAPL